MGSPRVVFTVLMLFPVLLLTAGCQYSGQTQIITPVQAQARPISLSQLPCTDRTGTKERDVAADATAALAKELAATPEFAIGPAGRYRLNCEVSEYIAGSAVQRWILPGWGQTVGKVSALLTDTSTGATVAIITGEARIAAGGFYTIGAETYIVDAAASDIARQLRDWARGVATVAPINAAPAAPQQGAVR